MASKIKLTNANGINSEVTLINPDSNLNRKKDVDISKLTTYVDTVADLASLTNAVGTVIVSDKDRGGIFNAIASTTANDGTIFDGSGCSWERQYDGAVNVKWFGAKGDGTTDDTVAIQNAINTGKSIIFGGADEEYLICSATRLYLKDNINININGSTLKLASNTYINGLITTLENPFASSGSQVQKASHDITIYNGSILGTSTNPGTGNKVPDGEQENVFLLGSFNDSSTYECRDIVFRDLKFKNLNGSAITSYQGERILVENCSFEDIFVDVPMSNGCAVQYQGTRESHILGCTGTHDDTKGDSWHFAIAVSWTTGAEEIIFSNNIIKNWTGGHLISLETNDFAKPIQGCSISNNSGYNITGGAICNLKGAHRTIVDGNNITNCSLGISALQAYDAKVTNNYIQACKYTGMAFENCFSNIVIANNTLRSIGTSGDTSDALGYLRGHGIYYTTTGTTSTYEEDAVIINANDLYGINGAGIIVSLTGGNTSMRAIISNNSVRNFGTQSSGASIRTLYGIFGKNAIIEGNYIYSNNSTAELAVLGVFQSKKFVDNTIEGNYTLGYYTCSGKSIWGDTTYLSDIIEWDGTHVIGYRDTVTLTSAIGGYDKGDRIYYNDPYTLGYVGVIRNEDGLTKADGTNCFNNFGAVI